MTRDTAKGLIFTGWCLIGTTGWILGLFIGGDILASFFPDTKPIYLYWLMTYVLLSAIAAILIGKWRLRND